MKNKKVKKILLWSGSVTLFLFIVLVIHILMVTKPVKYDNNNLQLSRIDFKQDIDSVEAGKIRHFVANLPGVNNAMFNIKDRNLVYGYMTGEQNSEDVYKQLMAFGNYKAERFIVSEEQLNSGCPIVADRSSLNYRFYSYIYKIFN
ncbi:MAG: hypothetical protein HYZ42_09280 [Bacteroidetes bacterium]|nr:hypothetical protein [Bacteroidota bacterium]